MTESSDISSLKFIFFSFTGLAVFSAILIICFEPGVMVNDDVVMMSFANGDFTGKPEWQLVFIGALTGVILKALYHVSQNMPWYALFLVFVQILSGTVFLITLFKFFSRKLSKQLIATVGLILIFTPILVLDLTFSTTAMYASVLGISSAGLIIEKIDVFSYFDKLSTSLILVLAISLRFDFFLAAATFTAPLFLLQFKKLNLKAIVSGSFFLLSPAIIHVVECEISRSGEWEYFYKFNDLRGSMHGTPGLSQFASTAYQNDTISKIRNFGWESEDLLLFETWSFEDKKIFNIDALQNLKKSLSSQEVYLPFQTSLESLFIGKEFLLLAGVFLITIGVGQISSRQKSFLVFQVAWFLLVCLYVASRIRFPDRFAVGAFLGLFVSFLVANITFESRKGVSTYSYDIKFLKYKFLTVCALVISSVFLLPHKFSSSEISERNKVEAQRLDSEISSISKVNRDATVVFIGGVLGAEGMNPWKDRTIFEGMGLLGLGWPSQSPHQDNRKSRMGLDGMMLDELVDKENRFLLTNQFIADLLGQSFERRTGKRVKFTVVGETTYGTVYKVGIEDFPK